MTEIPASACCALPYRLCPEHVEILLIMDEAGRWGLPEGSVRPSEAPFQTAEREAWEEAGVKGSVEALPIGGFDHRDDGDTRHILVYALEVVEEADTWPQAGRTRRRWTRAGEVGRLVESDLGHLVEDFAAEADAMIGDGASVSFERD